MSDRLTKTKPEHSTPADDRARGLEIIRQVLEEYSRDTLAGSGEQVWSTELEKKYRKAIHDATFGAGRLQALLDDPDAENIEMYGYDKVRVVYGDGRRVEVAPVADSDEELLETIQLIATHAASGSRPFSYPNPTVTMLLGSRHRLHAMAYNLSPRPLVTIRQHKHIDVTLDTMVELGMLTGEVANFLTHAVRAQKSIVIAGAQGSGKTTMLRALADAIPKQERIGTIETAFELLLHELPDQYPNVAPMQARAGGGEAGDAGAKDVADLLVEALTMNLGRILVGEVKQDVELIAMLHAMTASNGSLSTVHAKSGRHALSRLVSLATDRGGDHAAASHRVVDNIDLIVFCAQIDNRWKGGTIQRRVTEVHQLQRGEANHPAITKPLYMARDDDSPAILEAHPSEDFMLDLERVNYRPRGSERL
ncbi:CpaF family protein [Kribbella sp. NPDC059898]|uniref:CpaF family protein n=1 Tax=Kribbella sp. NPDC059898 TaxID=3346995 RepID=UPI00364B50D3